MGIKIGTPINRPCLLATHGAQPNACAARDLLPQGRLMGQLELKNGEEKSSPLTLFAVTPLTRFAGRDPRGVTNSTLPVTYRCMITLPLFKEGVRL